MGEDFQAGVCGSTWWSSPRGALGFSPCLVGMNDFGSFGWPSNDLVETKARSSTRKYESNSTFDQGFDQFIQKPSEGSLIDSSLQIMDISGLSSTTDWSQNLYSGSGSGSGETNYQSPTVQENMSSLRMDLLNSPNNEIEKEWSLNNISLEGGRDSTIGELKQINSNNTQGFPIESSLLPMSFIENLFGDDDSSPLENRPMNFSSTTGYRRKLHEISPFRLNENTSLWNTSTAAPASDITATISSSMIEKPNSHNLKAKSNSGSIQHSKKISAEPASKRARIETPSPLPSFKVRKEKLGDHITALQQLVSPFGKTDTASVLQEAIEYIKFLHDQVNVLSTPYMKNKSPIQQQQNHENTKDPEEPKQDLKSRGLCLVPISSTFPVANETTPDHFWTPSFGGIQDREHIQTSLNNAIFCPYLV